MFDYDLADRVDDLICIFDNGNPDSDMDTISILLTGWITFLFASILLMKFIYRKYKGKKNKVEPQVPEKEKVAEKSPSDKLASTNLPAANGASDKRQLPINARFKERKDASSHLKDSGNTAEVPAPPSKPMPQVPILRCSGPSPPVVEFVTASHNWLYVDHKRKDKISEHLNHLFLKSVNNMFDRIAHEENTFTTTVDDLSLSNDLCLQNLFAEYEGVNTIKITCDCEAKFNGHISMSSSSQLGPDSRHYEFIVNRFIGRLKFVINLDQKLANFKFDGWPEICLSIVNNSNNPRRLDPKLSEIITSKLSSALRNATAEIHLDELQNFPTLPIAKVQSRPLPRETSFLRVQLNGGVDIGLHKDSDSAYCVIELDDPAQKFQSRPKNLPNPIWNESYVLNTGTDGDAELLFEVYSAIGGTFLGCHIVSVDEIVSGRKEVLRLKSRRVKVAENISGTLEVVFTFVEEKEATEFIYQEAAKVIRQFDRSGPVVEGLASADAGDIPPIRPPRHSTVKLEDQYGEERGRRRTRRGDVFTSIRRRFSKERSKSVVATDVPGPIDLERNSTRSVSVDRPGIRVTPLGSDSTRSSASELSQHSSHSTATFMHESSTLLIECVENGVKRFYLIPPEEVGRGKWKNKKKLHIFNDHTFVAKRIQSGLSCTVCFGRFPFSLRKQGYQCRDCRLISHKECHIRIPTFCVKSTIYDIDVITL